MVLTMITKEYALAEAFSVSASTMSGAITGVQARLKMFNPRILYTHCFNHVLNLCLVDTVIVVDNARHFFDLLQAIFMSLFPGQQFILNLRNFKKKIVRQGM